MPAFEAPGSSGFGRWRVDPVTGEVYFDPGNPGGWPPGVSTDTARAVVRDATGAVAFAELEAEVTRVAAVAQIEQVANSQAMTTSSTVWLSAAPATIGDLRIAVLGRRRAGVTITGRQGMDTLIETSIEGLFLVLTKGVDAADAVGGSRPFAGSSGRSYSGRLLTISAGGDALTVRQSAVATGTAVFPTLTGVLPDSLLVYAWMTGGGGDLASPTLPSLSLPAREGVGVAVGVGPDEQRAGHALIEPSGSTSPAASVPSFFSFTALSVLEVSRL